MVTIQKVEVATRKIVKVCIIYYFLENALNIITFIAHIIKYRFTQNLIGSLEKRMSHANLFVKKGIEFVTPLSKVRLQLRSYLKMQC